MCGICSEFSILPFIPEILGGKRRPDGEFRVFPCFAALKTFPANVQILGRAAHLKLDQLPMHQCWSRIRGLGRSWCERTSGKTTATMVTGMATTAPPIVAPGEEWCWKRRWNARQGGRAGSSSLSSTQQKANHAPRWSDRGGSMRSTGARRAPRADRV